MDFLRNEIDSLLSPLIEEDMISGNILIADDQTIIYERSIGFADKENGIKNNSSTVFRIGSVTKALTSLAIFKLIENKTITLSDPISNFIPGVINGDKITVFHLLTHTSGIPGYNRNLQIPEMDALIEHIKTIQPLSEPGDIYEYSNSGYVLLTKIIEIVTQRTYEDFLRSILFLPCGMSNTGLYHPDANVRIANGYTREPYRGYVATDDRDVLGKGDGSIYSTVIDLHKLGLGIRSNLILNPETLQKATSAYKQDYACGWMVEKLSHHQSFYHYGGIPGFMSTFRLFSNNNISIICLFNNDNLLAYALEKQIANAVLGLEKSKILFDYDSVKDHFVDLLGEYDLGDSTSFVISEDNHSLDFTETGKPKCKVQITGIHSIFIKETNYRISFTKTAAGNWEFTAFLGLFLVTGEKLRKKRKMWNRNSHPDDNAVFLCPTKL